MDKHVFLQQPLYVIIANETVLIKYDNNMCVGVNVNVVCVYLLPLLIIPF